MDFATQILYANDIPMSCKESRSKMKFFINILHSYFEASSQAINNVKSKFYASSLSQARNTQDF
ncbi:hypothetical protein TSUD_174270 [Trifolium subterraneum]|nr:hypothetical protein TSUD_174270 [Trifolium subterraneum]